MGQLPNHSDPVDDLLGLLRNRRRRLVIYYLRNHTEAASVPVDQLASAIATMELAGVQPWAGAGAALPAAENEGRTRAEGVRISLVHVHLPKLDENGIVDYDVQNGTVRATQPPEEFWARLRSHQRFSAGLAATETD